MMYYGNSIIRKLQILKDHQGIFVRLFNTNVENLMHEFYKNG